MFIYLRQFSLILQTLVIIGLLLSGCAHYELSLNDRTLYDPTEFRRNIQFPDKQLLVCVKQVLTEQSITRATQLKSLQCGPTNIQSLAGLDQFTRLKQLGLAGNDLTDIREISALLHLEQLDLSHNQIVDASILGELEQLTWVNLSNNKKLNCSSVNKLLQRNKAKDDKLKLLLPKHCMENSY